jgi:polyphosphate kinase
MPRNFDRRVEAVGPVDDLTLHPRLHSLIGTCLSDNRQAWDLAADGTYRQRVPDGEPERATHKLLLLDSWGMIKPGEQKSGLAATGLSAEVSRGDR